MMAADQSIDEILTQINKEARRQSKHGSAAKGTEHSWLEKCRGHIDTHRNTPTMKATKSARDAVPYSLHLFQNRSVALRSYEVVYAGLTDRLWAATKSCSKAYARAQLMANVIANSIPSTLYDKIQIRLDVYYDVDGTTEDRLVQHFFNTSRALCLNKKNGNAEPGVVGYRHLYVVSFGRQLQEWPEMRLTCSRLCNKTTINAFFFSHCMDYAHYHLFINSHAVLSNRSARKLSKSAARTEIQQYLDRLRRQTRKVHAQDTKDVFDEWDAARFERFVRELVAQDPALLERARQFPAVSEKK